MILPEWLESFFSKQPEELTKKQLVVWQDWLEPISADVPTGEDIAYDDDFEAVKSEVSKLSGIDTALIVSVSERLIKNSAKDLRIATYYTYASLREKGLIGFAEGLWLISGLLQSFGQDLWPKKDAQKRNALMWLNSEKVQDALEQTDCSQQGEMDQVLSALALLQNLLVEWSEEFRPDLTTLLKFFEQKFDESSFHQPASEKPEGNSTAEQMVTAAETQAAEQIPTTAITSTKALIDQTRLISAYLRGQENGYWAAYKMVRAVRWASLNGIPPHNNNQTRLKAPRHDLQATLKRLIAEQQWLDLIERVEMAFLEGVNHYWLDLQYYAWQGQRALGGIYASQTESSLFELKFFLERCEGLTALTFEDGSPFVSDNVAEWLQKQVMSIGNSTVEAAVVKSVEAEMAGHDYQAFLKEAEQLAIQSGLETAMAWLETQPQLQSGKAYCHKLLWMAKMAEARQKSDWALYLIEHAAEQLSKMSVPVWDKEFAFEVYIIWYKLLFAKTKRKDAQVDAHKIQEQISRLQNNMMQIDAVRALAVFH